MNGNYSLSEDEEFEYIKKINNYLIDYEKKLESINHISHYKLIIFSGEKICDLMLALYTKKLGYKVLESEMMFFLKGKNLIPKETIEFIELVLDFHELRHLNQNPPYEVLVSFLNAFNYFFLWFDQIYAESFSLKNPFEIKKISKIIFNLPKNKIYEAENQVIENPENSEIESTGFVISYNGQVLTENPLNFLLQNVMQIKEYAIEIKDQLDDIQKELQYISKQFSEYQIMVENQLECALFDDEKDRIIKGYIDSCAEKFKNFSEKNSKETDFIREKKKLQNFFEENTWNKLSEESKTFLISSRLMYNEYILIDEQIDYSGVCILVTKALELEISKRFFTDFLGYLDEKYHKNYSKYHTALTFKNYSRLYDHQFTMGSIAYVMCLKSGKYDTPEQEQNNKKVLMEYCKDCIFTQKGDDEIEKLLNEYAKSIEKVREDFRNPSAHRNKIKQGDAEACFKYIIDVDKILKNMLNSFDY